MITELFFGFFVISGIEYEDKFGAGRSYTKRKANAIPVCAIIKSVDYSIQTQFPNTKAGKRFLRQWYLQRQKSL